MRKRPLEIYREIKKEQDEINELFNSVINSELHPTQNEEIDLGHDFLNLDFLNSENQLTSSPINETASTYLNLGLENEDTLITTHQPEEDIEESDRKSKNKKIEHNRRNKINQNLEDVVSIGINILSKNEKTPPLLNTIINYIREQFPKKFSEFITDLSRQTKIPEDQIKAFDYEKLQNNFSNDLLLTVMIKHLTKLRKPLFVLTFLTFNENFILTKMPSFYKKERYSGMIRANSEKKRREENKQLLKECLQLLGCVLDDRNEVTVYKGSQMLLNEMKNYQLQIENSLNQVENANDFFTSIYNNTSGFNPMVFSREVDVISLDSSDDEKFGYTHPA